MKQVAAFLILFVTLIFNTNILFGSELDSESVKIVEEIFKDIASHKVVRADFTQTKYINKLDRSIISQGVLIFDSELGIYWNILKPFASTIVLTKNSMIQINSSGEKAELKTSENDTFNYFSNILQAIFLGEYETVIKEYDITYKEDIDYAWQITLYPKDTTLKQFASALEIKGDDYIEFFKIHETNNDFIIYRFNNITFPMELSIEERKVFNQ